MTTHGRKHKAEMISRSVTTISGGVVSSATFVATNDTAHKRQANNKATRAAEGIAGASYIRISDLQIVGAFSVVCASTPESGGKDPGKAPPPRAGSETRKSPGSDVSGLVGDKPRWFGR